MYIKKGDAVTHHHIPHISLLLPFHFVHTFQRQSQDHVIEKVDIQTHKGKRTCVG